MMIRIAVGIGSLSICMDSAAVPADVASAANTALIKQVQPVLKQHCFKCHGEGEKLKGGLRLNSRAGLAKGGDTGPVVNAADPDKSLLLAMLSYKDDRHQMPPDAKLPAAQIALLTAWVKAGAPWIDSAGHTEPAPAQHAGGKVTPESRQYWAYQPVRRAPLPQVKNTAWIRTPVDAFVLAKLDAAGLAPAPAADRLTLIRRVSYDLTGLPPTPEAVDAFLNDKATDAYEKLVDRLLATSQYGEKWGRHWLDLVRYAETNGYERDGAKPFAWRFRDYAIKSFNTDKPFDEFIREQIAGDEMARRWEAQGAAGGKSAEAMADAIIATGYFRLGVWDDEPADRLQARYDEYDDMVATTSQVFLGMTMNCARCHDHKIDPIPQADYYKLVAFFRDVRSYSNDRNVASSSNLSDISPPSVRARYEVELKARETRLAEVVKAMEKIEDAAIKKMPAEDQRAAEGVDRPQVVGKLGKFFTPEQGAAYARLKGERDALKKRPEPPNREMALSVNACDARPPQQHVLIRGNPHVDGAKVEPGFPEVLGVPAPVIAPAAPNARSSGRRSVLADWIASKENPLTARVFVNRLWQFHFGRGIVASANDFGKFGVLPSHPELLDWLASEFIAPTWNVNAGDSAAAAWKIKRMHQLILFSNAYRMSSQPSASAQAKDPGNQWFWRFPMRRLTAEELRDSLLVVSGRLNLKQGGPSIYPPIPKEVLAGQSVPGQGWPTTTGEEANRRSVYVHIKRSLLVPIMSQHDMADTDSSCAVRYTTVVPTQSLGMLNGAFANEQARAFAERLQRDAPGDLVAQVRRAIRLTTGRQPNVDEVSKDIGFIKEAQSQAKLSEFDALRHYCLMALNANEFVYLD